MGMAKCGRNTVGSLVLAPACDAAAGGFRLWPLLSAASLRRKLVDALLCGVSSHRSRGVRRGGFRSRPPTKQRRQNPPSAPPSRAGSDRLSDLLKVDMSSESEPDEAEAEAETRRKVEALEELQRAVKELQFSEDARGEWGDRRREAAMEVRRLAKGYKSILN